MISEVWQVLKAALAAWQRDQGGRLGAALAFYTALSLAPFFIFSVTIAGFLLERDKVRVGVLHQVALLVGAPGVEVTEMLFRTALEAYGERSGIYATGIGVLVLLFSASAVLHELRDALNLIFRVAPAPQRGLLRLILERFVSIALVFSFGFLLAVSLLFSASLTAFTGSVSQRLGLPVGVLGLLDVAFNLLLLTLLFGLVYKYLPHVKLRWREVGAGAFLTATLFTAGKWSIGLFLGNSFIASAYGAAGSLIVFLLWVFFTAQLFFFGAEVVKVYHQRASGETAVPDAPIP